VQFGATGPMTIAGAVVVKPWPRVLMSIVLAQLRKPGCPICLSCNCGVLDMGTTRMTVGRTQRLLGPGGSRRGGSVLWPAHLGPGRASDAKMVDAQSGAESMFGILAQAMAGLNLIHDVGYLEAGMACSCQQLVFGNEFISMVKHFMKGITVNKPIPWQPR
jgi:trimethylamine--corrinoid protein Co-methyltransferase